MDRALSKIRWAVRSSRIFTYPKIKGSRLQSLPYAAYDPVVVCGQPGKTGNSRAIDVMVAWVVYTDYETVQFCYCALD